MTRILYAFFFLLFLPSCSDQEEETLAPPPEIVKQVGTSGNILVLSGGGNRGACHAIFLSEMLNQLPEEKPIHEIFKLGTGTSIGGILLLLLALPKEKGSKEAKFTPSDLLKLFQSDEAKQIGKPDWSFLKPGNAILGDNLRKFLKPHIGDLTMGDLLFPVAVTIWLRNDEMQSPYYIRSWMKEDKKITVLDAACATASIPGVFKDNFLNDSPMIHHMKALDGAFFDNTPAVKALDFYKEIYREENPFLLILGTGEFPPKRFLTKSVWNILEQKSDDQSKPTYACDHFNTADQLTSAMEILGNYGQWRSTLETLKTMKSLGVSFEFKAWIPLLLTANIKTLETEGTSIEKLIQDSTNTLQDFNWINLFEAMQLPLPALEKQAV